MVHSILIGYFLGTLITRKIVLEATKMAMHTIVGYKYGIEQVYYIRRSILFIIYIY